MARPYIWPRVDPELDQPASVPSTRLPDTDAFAASVGPELTRLFGVRTTARADANAEQAAAPMVPVAELHVTGGAGNAAAPEVIDLLASETDLSLLMDLLFGGSTGEQTARLTSLPPASASWMALAGFLATAATRSLAALGTPCVQAATLPPRPVALDPAAPGFVAPQLLLGVNFDGTATMLGLRSRQPQPQLPKTPAPDPELWRQRTQERALEIDLPVSLRLAERKLPIGEVAQLNKGAILPLERPDNVEVLVGGQPFASISVSDLAPPAGGEEASS